MRAHTHTHTRTYPIGAISLEDPDSYTLSLALAWQRQPKYSCQWTDEKRPGWVTPTPSCLESLERTAKKPLIIITTHSQVPIISINPMLQGGKLRLREANNLPRSPIRIHRDKALLDSNPIPFPKAYSTQKPRWQTWLGSASNQTQIAYKSEILKADQFQH